MANMPFSRSKVASGPRSAGAPSPSSSASSNRSSGPASPIAMGRSPSGAKKNASPPRSQVQPPGNSARRAEAPGRGPPNLVQPQQRPSHPPPQPSSQEKPHPKSAILDHQNQNYRYNLRPTAVPKFPQSQPVFAISSLRQQQQKATIPASSVQSKDRPSTFQPDERTERGRSATAASTMTAAAPSRASAKIEAGEALVRDHRRPSGRIVTDIDSPSPSEASSRAPSRAPSRTNTGSVPTDGATAGGANEGATTIMGLPARQHDTLRVPPRAAQPFQFGERPNSKVFTSFPFPHPTSPTDFKFPQDGEGEREREDETAEVNEASQLLARDGEQRRSGVPVLSTVFAPLRILGGWIDRATNIFAGPYERRLMREEAEDDAITRRIVEDLERGEGSISGSRRTSLSTALLSSTGAPASTAGTSDKLSPSVTHYGTLRLPGARASMFSAMSGAGTSGSADSEIDSSDPYGYRRLAGPMLLPTYNADLAVRRRERRRARSRARFQCMALWTVWTVCVVLIILIIGSGASVWRDWQDGRFVCVTLPAPMPGLLDGK